MVEKVVRVARYRDIWTDSYGCKGCKECEVQRQIDRQVWLQGFQGLQSTETDRHTAIFAKVAKVGEYSD